MRLWTPPGRAARRLAAAGLGLLLALPLAADEPAGKAPNGGEGPAPRAVLKATGAGNAVSNLRFSPDGKVLVSGDAQGNVKLWDPASKAQDEKARRPSKANATMEGGLSYRIMGLALRPDGKVVATVGLDEAVRIWDLEAGKQVAEFKWSSPTGRASGRAAAFSPDGKVLASGGDTGGGTPVVRVWDADKGKEIRTLEGNEKSVMALAFSPDGKLLASGDLGGNVILFDPATGATKATFADHKPGSVQAVAFSPDGKLLATIGQDGMARVWDVQKAALARAIKAHKEFGMSVAFSPDGKTLATGGKSDKVHLWDVETGKEIASLWGDRGYNLTIAFSPDGKTLALAGQVGLIKLYDLSKVVKVAGNGREQPAKGREESSSAKPPK
jgi:WD40 repeat protein